MTGKKQYPKFYSQDSNFDLIRNKIFANINIKIYYKHILGADFSCANEK